MLRTTRFDAAAYLDTPTARAEYLTAAFETGDADFVRDALGVVARAEGMARVAKRAKRSRESLHVCCRETRHHKGGHRPHGGFGRECRDGDRRARGEQAVP